MLKMPEIENVIYLVSTPIGSIADFTLKALDLLTRVDVLIAEDKRVLRRLMSMHKVPLNKRTIYLYNDHSANFNRTQIVSELKSGKSVAYFSDAGTPLISDPGFKLVDRVISEGFEVKVAPGASSVLAAICLSGLPTDRFLFNGFVPTKKTARNNFLLELKNLPFTLIFLESPKRLVCTLDNMATIFGDERFGVICREITKLHEEITRNRLNVLRDFYANKTSVKGEIVIVIEGFKKEGVSQVNIDEYILDSLKKDSLKDTCSKAAKAFSLPKKVIYQRALELKTN